MQTTILGLQIFISAVLISVAIASKNNRDSERLSQNGIEVVPENMAANGKEYPSRLATAIPLTNRKWTTVASSPEESPSQKKIIVSVPIETAALIPRASNLSQQQLTDKGVSSKPQFIPVELTLNTELLSRSNNTSEVVKRETNDTLGDDKAVSPKPQMIPLELTFNRESSPRPNNTSETAKRETNATHGETTTEKVVTKPATVLPTHPPAVIHNSSTASSNSTSENSQPSQLLLSVQAVQGAYVPSVNVTDFGSLSNKSSNGSAVLISNTREIEVVIIAEKPPDPAPPETTTVFQPLLASPASGHRFRSSLVFRNDSLLDAQRPIPTHYAPRHYWAVYLTLSLLILSVLAICVLCCSSQGRRDMSLPKPLQYGHELPPYSYAFSYDMRQADSQEAARLNTAVP